ncbi:hypothetical protein SCLCIDRAFT_1220091 [Scleroderma citrinum Foug A]|uniref:Uncharacterized protein n=1 Tax=Scleroderma citrinum Foug A TaxID=1036808 RepID=A0A0C2ZWF9_9AGAM|nr:hypothetical protein SCLCIDRAFT_1220091 [Scleroderma citrinum Foug A]
MPKENLKTADSPSSQRRYSPYLTPSASGGPSALTRPRRGQDVEGPPHPPEPWVANPTASVGNEAPSVVFQEPIAIDLEDVGAVVLKFSNVTGPTEATAKGRAAATDEKLLVIQPIS